MSFVNYKDAPEIVPTQIQEKASQMTMRIDVVPVPQGTLTTNITSRAREAQYNAIKKIKSQGKDLFMPNNTVVSTNASNKVYQTADLYNPTTPIEKLATELEDNNLTLRLNAIRTGVQSHTTCMNLTTTQLKSLLEESVDGKNEKSCAVSLPSKEQGTMYVGVKVRGGKHYITKVDYEVNSLVDSKLHVTD